jgi:hypothetical protein
MTRSSGQFVPRRSGGLHVHFHGNVGRSLLVVVISLSRHSSSSLPKHFVVAAYGATDTGINSIHSIHSYRSSGLMRIGCRLPKIHSHGGSVSFDSDLHWASMPLLVL